jgi:hypothetical protein
MHAPAARALAVVALALAAAAAPDREGAAVAGLALLRAAAAPPPAAAFPDPLAIDNPHFPFQPGGFKVYGGYEGRRRVTVVEQHLAETRTFTWQGEDVACRILREVKFERGVCAEISRTFLAQGADGGVWCFGEISEPVPPPPEDDGDDEPGDSESSDWIVGALAPTDPPGTTPDASPSLRMPAVPAAGAPWKPEDLYPVADETDEVVREGVRLRVPAGVFRGCLEVLETSALEPGSETKWYAPGVGTVKERTREGGLRLQVCTLQRR